MQHTASIIISYQSFPGAGDDTSPGQEASACSSQETRTSWSSTTQPSAEQAWPVLILGSIQGLPGAAYQLLALHHLDTAQAAISPAPLEGADAGSEL